MTALRKRIQYASMSVRHALAGLARDVRGVSAVEFAFILPIMVVIYIGCVEVSQAVSANRKVTIISSSIGDLVAQTDSIDKKEIDDIFEISESIIRPFPTDTLKMRVSSIWIDEDKKAKVEWSEGKGLSKLGTGSNYSVPAGLLIPETSLIVAEVKYKYQPIMGDYVTGDINLDEVFFLTPRQGLKVERVD